MIFRLVPKSVILNDLERRHGPYLLYFTKFGSSGAHCLKLNSTQRETTDAGDKHLNVRICSQYSILQATSTMHCYGELIYGRFRSGRP